MQYLTSDSSLELLELSVRSYNALTKIGIDTVGKLLEMSFDDLRKVRSLGQKSTDEIRDIVVDIRNGENGILFVADGVEQTEQQESQIENVKRFYDCDGILRKDIPIDGLDLSVRAYNCLNNSEIHQASELIELTEEDLFTIPNMGVKTVQEVLNKVKSLCFEADVPQETLSSDHQSIAHQVSAAFGLAVKENINIHAGLLQSSILEPIKMYIGAESYNKNDKTVQDYLNDPKLIDIIYSQEILRNAAKNHIILKLQSEPYGISYTALEAHLPDQIIGTETIAEILDEMHAGGDIIFTDQGVETCYPTVSEYVRTITDDRARALLIGRLNGETLEELGQKNDITRERVRQIVAKLIRKMPRLIEARYQQVFEKYFFEKQDFMTIFDEPESTYNYLNMAYSRGHNTIEALIGDADFPLSFRRSAEKVVYRNYLTIEGERVKITKSSIMQYVLKTYFRDEASFEDFINIYMIFLQEHNLDSNEELQFDEHTYINKLSDADYVLWKQHKRLRYYDIVAYDFEELKQTLAFDQYSDIEYSTRKFFRDYPQLMHMYDVRDEYELHNLLKKLNKDEEDSNINFRRMPTIEFGTANRDMQVFELLLQYAPVSLNDLADAYELEYGVRSETVKANYLKSFDEYFYNGMYTIDSEALLAQELERLNAVLTDDFYSISEIRRIYLREMPDSDANTINPFNIKMLGFRVFSSYAVRNVYSTAVEYFRKVLTDPDIVNLQELPKAMIQAISFTSELAELKSQYEIIEFSPSQLINIRRLEAIEISKDYLHDYCDSVCSATEQGSYFTIYSLRKNGFSHLLDELGFEEWFYSSILCKDSNHFTYRRMGNTRVFLKGKHEVMLIDFIESMISERQSIDIYDLINLMEDDYGVTVDKQKVMGLVNSSAMYYDSIMEKVYIDYDTYFEEV